MRKWVVTWMLVGMVGGASAQYIPAQQSGQNRKAELGEDYWHYGNTFHHLNVSLSLGATGIGIDLATPLSRILQLRVGYDYLPAIKKTYNTKVIVAGQTAPKYGSDGNRIATPFDRVAKLIYDQKGCNMNEEIGLKGQLTMQNLRVMVDLYPFHRKDWHVTAGFYYGPEKVIDVKNTSGSAETLKGISLYNALYDEGNVPEEMDEYGDIGFNVGDYYRLYPDANNEIRAKVKTKKLKPYLGIGYSGRLLRHRDDLWLSFECGALFWGGSPDIITNDNTYLTKNVKGMSGTVKDYVNVVRSLKVYPHLGVRLTKTIF